ncbi:hypothetical protein [Hymenobacter fodinae]|uniref:Uncharacterized protein n=1 Tax=Hymenobacter fodinae TaxID=2510796 RepID=A0A4Z0P734_9BACT|nr:hypothetical protein [Hymenobacter fodinae]TGE07735.1 hypothetical protein EU556_08250 [Hymenobacter fodinae]
MDSTKTESQQDKLNRLYTEYGLLKEDVHKHQHYTIIRRTGIEKIAAKAGIRLAYKLVKVQPDFAVVKATGKMGKGTNCVTAETYGSAGKDTSQNKYYVEMAEKRAKSRCVLQLTDFYAMGVFGEDEADDFSRANNPAPQAEAPRPTVAAPAPEASAPASVPQAAPTTAEPSAPAPDKATESKLQQLVKLIASPELDKEERDMLLSVPVDQRPESWVDNTLAKLPAVIAERKDPAKALATARNQMRIWANKNATAIGQEYYEHLMARASALTAKAEDLRREVREAQAQLQAIPA